MMLLGVATMTVSELATIAGIEPFASWNTPICWTGFILFADAVVYRARGRSWIRSTPREFAALALVSIPLWVVFEGFNLALRNWHYTGLPENTALRLFGYAWSFATISPAIFEGAELVAIVRARGAGKAGWAGWGGADGEHRGAGDPPALRPLPAYPALSTGALLLLAPLFVTADVARYMAAPVFLGFIFLLDPINRRLGEESLGEDLANGRTNRLVNLLASGLLCGVLWEFWNYWAHAKWHYTVPIMEHLKIFEMPLPGYLGFPPFALECFTMYVFVRAVWRRAIGAFAALPSQPGHRIAL
jgi:hypothetical protein